MPASSMIVSVAFASLSASPIAVVRLAKLGAGKYVDEPLVGLLTLTLEVVTLLVVSVGGGAGDRDLEGCGSRSLPDSEGRWSSKMATPSVTAGDDRSERSPDCRLRMRASWPFQVRR